MTDFSGKLPWVQDMAKAIEYRQGVASEDKGWELPCKVAAIDPTGLFVTVEFATNSNPYQLPKITIPVNTSQYVRLPLQVGDPGVTRCADASLLPISGLTNGITDFRSVGNLNGILSFEPIANKGFPANPNINALWMYGPNGVTIQDEAGNSVVTITPTGITLQSGTSFISIAKNGAIDIEGTSVKIMGKDFLGHEHSGVQTGTSNTGGVA